ASIRSMPALGGPRWLQHGLEEEHHPALDLCDLRWALRAHRLAGFLDVDNHMPLAATHRPTSFEEKQLACAINMRERFSGLQTKRCCEESTEANCLACCEEHFASRGGKCVEVCSTMCAFGWDKGNRKVPQCPEKLGSEDGGAEEWYAEDPMKDRPRPATPDKKVDPNKQVDKALSLGF
ncbi:unnamed protein product, partial [Effrenium voratum]